MIIRVTNLGTNASDAILKYKGPQGPEELDVLAGQIVTKEIIFTTSMQPATVEVKGYEKATNSHILINGKSSILVIPTLAKFVNEIDISDQGMFCKFCSVM